MPRKNKESLVNFEFSVECIPAHVGGVEWYCWQPARTWNREHGYLDIHSFKSYGLLKTPLMWPCACNSAERLCTLVVMVPGCKPRVPGFLCSSGSGTGSTQPRENKLGATWKIKQRLRSRKLRLMTVWDLPRWLRDTPLSDIHKYRYRNSKLKRLFINKRTA
jgi:hypothetical protein